MTVQEGPEQELYHRAVAIRRDVDVLIEDVLRLPGTIELCLFAGKIGAVLDILMSVQEAGVPVRGADEEPHQLGG